jgi:hydrogenase-1 operon protein HyaE
MSLPQAFIDRMGVPLVHEANVDDILARDGCCVLALFAGDPAQRPEATDVAVIFPELLKAFAGRLSGALVAGGAEKALGARFHVDVLPSLAIIRGGATIGVVSRIRDWAEYVEKIEAFLDPAAPQLAREATPRVAFTFSRKGAEA